MEDGTPVSGSKEEPLEMPANASAASAPDAFAGLKELLARGDPRFFTLLRERTLAASGCEEVLRLSALRRKAMQKGFAPHQRTLRLAVIGGYTPYPLNDLIVHYLATLPACGSIQAECFSGEYDNYIAEIVEESSRLYEFKPEAVLLLPSHRRCRYSGELCDAREKQEAEARETAAQILDLCRLAHDRSGAEIVLANFPLPPHHDPGSYRTRTLGSDWNFRKYTNLELGLTAPPFVHICDVEFLSARRGGLGAWDARAWFESKQPYGRELLLDVARETAHLISSLRQSSKKVAILDLDNTLWGGIIGDDGLEGIEIGDTSPRGEAFKAFQQCLLALTRRGVLLAVCSKNDYEKAVEPFEKHPEMALRMKDFASFKANWQPKPENIREIGRELNLGLDSLVMIDDNPAEIEIVKQFLPEVSTLLLGHDPSEYVAALQDARFFEPRSITAEDAGRVIQYRQEAQRQQLLTAVTDMDAYLESLHMEAAIREFRDVDVPRIAQLINKSNQFNLTTRRRTEAEVRAVMVDPASFHFTVRLRDRFGDYGLVSVVIGRLSGEEAEIDTWLMSCRVLKRQLEHKVLNEIVRLSRLRGCRRLRGVYIPTARNGMVREHYAELGFTPVSELAGRREFTLDTQHYEATPTRIRLTNDL